LLDGEALKKIVSSIFKTLGVSDEDALLGADVLVRLTSGEWIHMAYQYCSNTMSPGFRMGVSIHGQTGRL